ncbi:MAG: WG repeat-containing protein [Bacteroidales bacterium]|nr:WG repeat-containing protein [Bacteroidales bacterium]
MKKIFLILVAVVISLSTFAQPTFEKMYQGSDAIVSLGGDFFAIKKDSKWGVMKNSTLVLDFYYDSIDVLYDGIITYIKNDQAGFADTVGNIITLAVYPMETPYNRADESVLNVFQSGSALVYDGGKLILLGKDGKQVNDNTQEIVSKSDNCVIFKKDGAYGILDAKGNVIVANKYRRIQTVIAGELYAYTAQKDGMDYLGLIDKSGALKSKAEYDDLTIINKNDKFYIKAFVSTGKQALYDAEGNLLFNPLYQNVEPLTEGNYCIYTDNGRKGLIGKDYVTYIPAAYDDLQMVTLKSDTLFVAKNDDMTYILTVNNKTLDAIKGNIKDFVSYNNNELIYIADSMLNYGVRSNKRGWLLEPQYLDVFAESKGSFVVRQKDKWGAVDLKGNTVIPFDYKKVRASKSKTCIVFYDGKKNSVILRDNGKQIEFPKTDNVLPMTDYIEYKIKGERVRLYFNGTELKDKFLTIGTNKDGVLCAKVKKGWSYFNSKTYEQLTDQYFDYATGFEDGVAYVVKNKKLLQIDKNYNITSTILDDSYTDLNNTAAVLSMAKHLRKNTITITDKNGKKTLIKINK